jgi:hypothetical protein
MKKLSILFVLTFMLLNSLYSQEKTKSKEVGLYFSNLNAFGIRYKFGNEKHMFRLTALSLNVGTNKSDNGNGNTQDIKTSGAGMRFGIEFPVKITENFNFYYGGELGASYSHYKSEITDNDPHTSNSYGGEAGFVLGFAYIINPSISLSAELVPGFNYSYSKLNETKVSAFGFGISNNSAGLTLSYRF